MRRIATLLLAVSMLVAAGTAEAAAPRYVGAPIVDSPAAAPFTVILAAGNDSVTSFCTGAIIDATHVLTAAHCTNDGQQPWAVGSYDVLAGTSQLRTPTAGAQERGVLAVRVHPAYSPALEPLADVAILQLSAPLTFNASVAAIPVVAIGTAPATGAPVRGFGWGDTSPDAFDGFEHDLDMSVRAPTDCLMGFAGFACAHSASGGVCSGDSGGPIVAPASGVVLGVASVSIGGSCVVGNDIGFTDLSAPGIGLWVRGNDSPPAMPYTDKPATLTPPPLTGGVVTCVAPAWTNAATTTTLFEHRDGGAVVQQGPANTYVPKASDVGHDLACRSLAQSPGGSAFVPAEATLTVTGVQLSLRAAKQAVALSYSGAPGLALRVTLSDGRNRQVWTRNAGSARSVRLPRVRAGVYRVCVDAPAAGQFASAQACQRWRSSGKR